MHASDDFELIESVTADALARHPVWSHWNPEVDRERVLAWGVAPEALDHQLEKFKACGLVPLYPVADFAALSDRKGLTIAARFETADGARLSGYVLEPHAFGIFHRGEEYSFNRSLPAYARRESERLADALGASPDTLFPLFFRLDVSLPAGEGHQGEIARFW